MLDRYDQTDLLDLIEGNLDHASAAALRTRLAADPLAAARVEAMIRDRASIRDIEEPALPHDFIATIEPMLSRPMLIEPTAETMAAVPGEFRRQQHRRRRPMRLGRLAVAAMLLLAAMGGAWTLLDNLGTLTNGGGFDDGVAMNGQPHNPDARRAPLQPQPAPGVTAVGSVADIGPGTIHHALRPDPSNSPAALATANSSASPSSAGEPSVLLAEFAIVITAKSTNVAEERFTMAMSNLNSPAALVRNFSYGEAQALSEEYRLAHAGPTREGERNVADLRSVPTIAPGTSGLSESSISRREMQQLAARVREQLRSRAGDQAPGSADASNVLLAGEHGLSPTLEQQLEFSSRGATHTIAVPASELVTLIERITLADPTNAATSLHMLPSPQTVESPGNAATEPSPSSALAWLNDGPLVRTAMQRLLQAPGNAIVLLPVIVK